MADESSRGNEPASIFRRWAGMLPRRRGARTAIDAPSRDVIESWLIERIAHVGGLEPHEIDVREPFTSFGLDSRTAVSLSGDLEQWLGRRLSPTLVWDYPSIDLLATYLADPSAVAAPVDVDEESIPGVGNPAGIDRP
jgi:acyl carrier protein